MKKQKFVFIEPWQKIIITWGCIFVAIAIFIFYLYPCKYNSNAVLIDLSSGFLISAIAAIFILQTQKYIEQKRLFRIYNKIEGNYERIDIGNDLKKPEDYQELIRRNKGLKIKLEYLGGHGFKSTVEYWKSDFGVDVVEAIFHFSDNNSTTAFGKYKYTNCHHKPVREPKGDHKGHFGTYTIHRDLDSDELVVLYEHLYPREYPNDIITNRGWERWSKVG